MNKRVFIINIMLLLGITFLIGCSFKNKKNNTVQENQTSEEVEETTVYIETHLDDSEMRTDISHLMEDDITEARIYWANKIYNTYDQEVILEIKKMLSSMELKEVEEIESAAGSYNLYLISGNKILYFFDSDTYSISVGYQYYEATEEVNKIYNEVIQYARKTFWKD